LILVTFWSILVFFGGFGETREIQDPKGPPFENMLQLLRYATSSAHVGDPKGNTFRRRICSLSFVVLRGVIEGVHVQGEAKSDSRPFVPEDHKKPGPE